MIDFEFCPNYFYFFIFYLLSYFSIKKENTKPVCTTSFCFSERGHGIPIFVFGVGFSGQTTDKRHCSRAHNLVIVFSLSFLVRDTSNCTVSVDRASEHSSIYFAIFCSGVIGPWP